MGGHSSNTVPRPVAGIDARNLGIGPEEKFVLACIDGATSEADIAESTGLTLERTAVIVDRLVALGAVALDDSRGPAQPARTVRSAGVSATHSIKLPARTASPADDSDFSARLQRLHASLDSASHYELLSVAPNADVSAIKQAFHDFIRVFHPDRHFGEDLGSLRPMLDRVVTRLNEAYATLSRAELRQEYDLYQAALGRTKQLDTVLDREADEIAELQNVERLIEQAAREAHSRPPPIAPASSVPPSGPRPRASISFAAPDEAARRKALAMKLGLSSRPPAPVPASSSAPTSSPGAFPSVSPAARAAGDELKARYDQRLQRERQVQIQRFIDLADAAAAKGDLAGATNALRVAHSLAPENQPVAERLASVEQKAANELWEVYVERAKYEAREGRFGRAGRSYERAALGHPSGRLFERAAWCYLESGGDLRRAGELAHRAVELEPQNARCRLALARYYSVAQKRPEALAELERAIALAPGDTTIRDWIRRIKREG